MDEKLYYSNGPSEWEYRQLGDVVTFQGGSQPPKKYFSNEKLDGMIRLIQIRDYKSNSFKTYVPKELCRRFCNSDDIMIGRYGPPIFQILRGIDGAYNVALIKAIPNEEVLNKEYLYYFIKNEHLFKLIDGLSQRTSGQTGIDMEVLKKYIIPIPSKDEQEKIASILSTVDEQIDNVDALIEKNKELKKGLMQTLLTKGIGHTRFKKTEIGEIPEEWEVFSLMQISDKIGDGLHGTPKYDENGEYYFINGNNLVDGNIIVTQDTKKVSKEEYIKNNKELNNNSLLISLNGTIGNIAYYNDERIMLSKSSGYITLNDKCNKAYIYQLLQSSRINEYFNKELTGTTIKNLSLNTLRNTPTSIPSIKEQEQIASILSEADKKIEKYKNRKQKLKEIKKGLMQQLLTGRVRVN